ncbi:tRNA pseudouridine(65) synthase TruC [Pseudoalteromonas luteoviolacea]|uniref:tRNA pseudouridine synthase C n=1 Tax=Pseudoalteromonas luteoviolacea DSM 6061 TaxID=1365250 RepID=A0A166VGJ1_9GAMM|nr:tRNA pseudouridine(65) synthase TruC [Pseudoalteromonas luteoviolacea]KZN32705.1 pseudouridylate synthase [Pseudoalteromonas luteoviolacea DSM 6061]KZN50825.1 pseudouridylate synthase [Pseudoalteromonas luteoviolacea CPMOR-2]MBE0387137.1 tRNA pseudouridine65 synthase [Pseudoalteromonas luteoviolacea DSM 6061]TQF71982.1 tRNA pseudouridine(65) synthase TruC [Pseudoalteromonas luteoviolacea]
MLEIIYQDENYVAINKPSGLLVHRSFLDKRETQFAMQMLRDQLGQHVFPVHRLDRPTSGVLLFALSSEAARDINQLFIDGTVEKRYLALVRGYGQDEVFVDKPLKEQLDKIADKFADQDKAPQEAQTMVRCLHRASLDIPFGKYPSIRYSLVECFPKTGRKHQIRRHLNHLSTPIIGDVNHGDNKHNHFFRDHFQLQRLMLFATELKFIHPYTKQPILIRANLGDDMLDICRQLGWPSTEKDYQ